MCSTQGPRRPAVAPKEIPQPAPARNERYALPAHFDDSSLKSADAAQGRQGSRFDYLDVPAFLRRRTFQGK